MGRNKEQEAVNAAASHDGNEQYENNDGKQGKILSLISNKQASKHRLLTSAAVSSLVSSRGRPLDLFF